MIKPEILAPAGDWKSFVAAVEAGADAVYFAGKDFSARNFAINFTREEITRLIAYAHLRGVKCYATVNILIKDNEFIDLFDYINFLYTEGVDALIIQDLGVFYFCRKHWPDLAMHASTQISAHNLNDVFNLENMGFKRVILARELTLEEIQEIKNRTKIEIECFVHGALCFSYSGQCYLSSIIGGRSGNRGRCAQPCRKKYHLAEQLSGKILDRNGYLLSMRDLCALDILKDLFFIDSFKIEGRMKGVAYVGGVVKKYRQYVDSLVQNKIISDNEKKEDKNELASLFNRGGFSHGYWLDKKPANLIATERSKNFGVKVGEVKEVKNGRVKIIINNVNVNDGLEIWGRGGQETNFGFRAEKIINNIIEIRLDKDADIKIGDAVYKNFDYQLNKKLNLLSQENYQRRVPVVLDFSAEEGYSLVLKINGVVVKGEKAQKARQNSTSSEIIKAQLAKLGGTVFTATEVNVNIKGELNISLKDLNSLRREAVCVLENKIINSFKRKKKPELSDNLNIIENKKYDRIKTDKDIYVQSNDWAILSRLERKKISRIYTALKINPDRFHQNKIEVFQALPRIIRKGEKIEIFSGYDGFLVPALGYLNVLPSSAIKIGDFSLNIYNHFGARQLEQMGFDGFTASIENTLSEINNITAKKIKKEAIVYGYLPLMIAEHCVLRETAFCSQNKSVLVDEKKINFPVFTDCVNCRMQILNSLPLFFTNIENMATDGIRLMHTIETAEEFLKKVDNYLVGNFESKEHTTAGHFNRGVD